MKVALVCPPFASRKSPSLAIGLLKAALALRGHTSAVYYFNLFYAGLIGEDTYDQLSEGLCPEQGEHLFGEYVAPGRDCDPEFLAEFSKHAPAATFAQKTQFVRQAIELMVGALMASEPQVVGISSTFFQRLPALALAKRVKEVSPSTIVVLGGADVERPMGGAILRNHLFLDAVFHGEAEQSFPDFIDELQRRGGQIPATPGTSYRCPNTAEVIESPFATPVPIDSVPLPDFYDYEAQRILYAACGDDWVMPFEMSRGCWWGEKHHCIFCGLNGTQMKYRTKAIDRACSHLLELHRRHGARRIAFADNIAPSDAARGLLPALGAVPHESYFFETKANLRREDLASLSKNRVRSIQPGIERLNSQVLKVMRKGVSAYQCVQLMRWSAEHEIHLSWNILLGFPGEDASLLREEIALLQRLTHLAPPESCAKIRIDRFSPMFSRPQDFSIELKAPVGRDKWSGLSADEERAIAYSFEFDYVDDVDKANECLWAEIGQTCSAWKNNYRPKSFTYAVCEDAVLVRDYRSRQSMREIELSGSLAREFLTYDQSKLARGQCAQREEFVALEECGLLAEVDGLVIPLPTRLVCDGDDAGTTVAPLKCN